MQAYYTHPGLFLEEYRTVPRKQPLTGIPVFLGYVRRNDAAPCALTHWSEFSLRLDEPLEHGYLAYAVRGFFENGGTVCYVVPLNSSHKPEEDLRAALHQAQKLDDPDLLCAPDLMVTPSGQARHADIVRDLQAVLMHSGIGLEAEQRRFLLLDSLQNANPADTLKQCSRLLEAARDRGASDAAFADTALYYPWVAVPRLEPLREPTAIGERVDTIFVPPCGHIAGVYARTDAFRGIAKAPANEVLQGVLDLSFHVSDSDQAGLFSFDGSEVTPPGAVNCLRAFPGRGIRVWGARTLAPGPPSSAAFTASARNRWRYVNVRRLFLNAMRWMERYMAAICFEPHTPALEARIRREVNDYCYGLFRRGALKGTTTSEAFYVRCDETNNPRELREAGMIVAEVGLAAARPHEFIVIRLIRREDGTTTIAGATTDSL